MSAIVEQVAKAMWDARRANANNAGIFLEFWGDGTIPKANGIMDEARAAIEECAKVCDELRRADYSAETECWVAGTADCARALRDPVGPKRSPND